VFLYVLKILYWKSLKSKEVKHWWLKMKNLCALMEYLVWNIIFQNALLSFVWTFSFTLFYLTFTLAPLQPENKTFWFRKLKYLELQKSNWCKLNFFGFMTQRSINAPNFSQNRCHMRDIWFFKDDIWILPTNRFREETSPNYVPKHLNWYPSFSISNLAPLSQSLKVSRKTISLVLGK